jgi:triphosphoribosyl-dephospho-CoA synthase
MTNIAATAIPRTALDLAAAAQLACLLEASAPKPGNVSPGRSFEDVSYEDFLASAAAIGGPLSGVATRPLGSTIRMAVDATAAWAPSNTNLGIVLLLAPLVRAAVLDAQSDNATSLRDSLRRVLDTTTVDDAREVYAAIRRAAPGGLGRADAQDVAREPTVTLLDAMRLAAGRDAIAREYTTGFAITFETGAPALERARRDGLPWNDAVVETFLHVLAAVPDTHIARRGGEPLAVEVTREAQAVLAFGGVRSTEGREAIAAFDLALRSGEPGNLANPGTTADLTAAAIFIVLAGGGWRRSDIFPNGGHDAAPR